METESRLAVARGWKEGEWEVSANACEVPFQGGGCVLELVVMIV